MIEIQQDKASNGARLRKLCNAEGLAKCCKLPRALNDSPDDEILAFADQHNRVLLTHDRRIADEWPQSFAHGCPGVLIVALDDASMRQMTESVAIKMLRSFKDDCPAWVQLDCRNSVIELQPRYVHVSHFEANGMKRTGFVDRFAPRWQHDLQQLLRFNTSRVY